MIEEYYQLCPTTTLKLRTDDQDEMTFLTNYIRNNTIKQEDGSLFVKLYGSGYACDPWERRDNKVNLIRKPMQGEIIEKTGSNFYSKGKSW